MKPAGINDVGTESRSSDLSSGGFQTRPYDFAPDIADFSQFRPSIKYRAEHYWHHGECLINGRAKYRRRGGVRLSPYR